MTASQTKASKAFRTIREVADELNLEPHVLRFWEKEFKQIKPMQRDNGRRYYRESDVQNIRTIQTLLHEQGYTIKGAKAVLSGKVEARAAAPIASQNSMQAELKALQEGINYLREKIANAL